MQRLWGLPLLPLLLLRGRPHLQWSSSAMLPLRRALRMLTAASCQALLEGGVSRQRSQRQSGTLWCSSRGSSSSSCRPSPLEALLLAASLALPLSALLALLALQEEGRVEEEAR